MATEGGGKIKSKRQHDVNKPYRRQADGKTLGLDTGAETERRPSLLGKVTNTVKDILSPSWLVDLVSSVKKKSNESNTAGSSLASSIQNDGSSYLMQHHTPVYSQEMGMNMSDMQQTQPIVNRNWPSGPMKMREFQEADKWGYQMDRQVHPSTSAANFRVEESQMNSETGQWGHVPENSFLWSKPSSTMSAIEKKPSFNISAFGTSAMSPEGSIFGSNSNKSPFYPGKTTFGGVAAHRKSRQHSPYQMAPQRKVVTAKPAQSPGGSASLSSSTAKRILDTLERMSTPLSDAKKIPSYSSGRGSPISITPQTYSRSASRLEGMKQGGPPVQSRTTPNSNVDQSKLTVSKQIHKSHYKEDTRDSTQSYFKTQTNPSSKSMKMKQDRSLHFSKAEDDDDEVVVPDLPTEFTLPMVMPKFDFCPANTTNTTSASSFGLKSSSSSVTTVVSSGAPFTFSSPISKNSPSSVPNSSPHHQPFQFSSPLVIDKEGNHMSKSSSVQNVTSISPFGGFAKNDGLVAKNSSSLERNNITNMFSQTQSSVTSSGPNPAQELKIGRSVMDVLGKKDFPPKTSSTVAPAIELKRESVMNVLNKDKNVQPLSELFKSKGATWECDACMVRNAMDVQKCVACDSSRPKAKPASSSASIASTSTALSAQSTGGSLASMFKKQAGNWECNSCLVQNKADHTKCVACETPKPTSGVSSKLSIPQNTGFVPQTASTGFGIQFSKPAGSWECETCLIQNKSEATKCVACETTKPGKSTSIPVCSVPKVSGQGFNVPKKPSGTWDCDTCLVPNKASDTKCCACETPKPGSKPTTGFKTSGGFKFSMPSTEHNNNDKKSTAAEDKSSSALSFVPGGGFKINVSVTSAGNSSFKFDAPKDTKDATPVAGGFKFDAPKFAANDSKNPFTFGPKSTCTTKDKSATSRVTDSSEASSQEIIKPIGFSFGTGVKSVEPIKSETTEGKTSISSSPAFSFNVGSSIAKSVENGKPASVGTITFGVLPENDSTKQKGSGPSFTTSVEKKDTEKTIVDSKATENVFGSVKFNSNNNVSGIFGGNKTANSSSILPSTEGFKFGTKTTELSNTGNKAVFNSQPVSTSSSTFSFGDVSSKQPAAVNTKETSAKNLFQLPAASKTTATTTSTTTGSLFQFGATANAPAPFSFKPNESSNSTVALKRGNEETGQEGNTAKKSSTFGGSGDTGFKFGSSSSITSTAGFSFSTNTNTASSGSGFSGSKTGTTGFGQSGSFGGFATQSAPKTGFDTPAASTSLFGTPAAASPFGAASSTMPAFGSSFNKSETPSIFPAPANSQGQSVFPSKPTPATTADTISFSTTPNFSFGGAGGVGTSGTIQFGTNSQNQGQNLNSSASSTGGFSFSAQPQAAATSGFNFSNSPAASFNFGGSQPTSNAFQFNASGGSQENIFNATAAPAGSTQNRRVMKRAVRKIRR